MPSRAMLHTGHSLMRFPDSGKQLPEDIPTIGELLQQHGYQSHGCGKWHNGKKHFSRSFNHGSAIFFGGMSDHWNVPMHDYDPSAHYDDKTRTDKPEHHSSAIIADAAIQFIQDQSSANDPWFNYVSFLAPHDPRTMPQWFRDLYDKDIPVPDNFLPEHPFDTGALHIRDEELEDFPRTPNAIQKHLTEYYAMISHLDYEIGRIIDALDRSGQRENTIIILAGDNGLAVGSHGLMGKQNCYEHSMRVPLIMNGPGIPASQTRDQLCYLFDLFPTCCDLLDIQKPQHLDGQSLIPCLDDEQHINYTYIHTAYTNFQRAVRDQRWKLIRYQVNEKQTEQFFDLQNDPQEIHDLINDPDHLPEILRMRERLEDWRHDWHDNEHHWGQTFWGSCNEQHHNKDPRPLQSHEGISVQ